MASRTQIRLQQLTGSLLAPGSLGSEVALAALPAEHLGEILGEMGQAIARIHGEKDFTNKAAGVFGHASQFESTLQIDGAADLKSSMVVTGSAEMKSSLSADGIVTFSSADGDSAAADPDVGIMGHVAIAKDMQAANIKSEGTLHSDGEATLASAIVEDLTAGRVVLAGTAGAIEDHANLTFDGTILSAPEADFSTEMVAASAKVSDLTSGRVVLAGTDGEIEDSANLAFNGSKLTVTGEQQVTSHMDIDGQLDAALAVNFQAGLTVASNADFNGELDVAGASSFAAAGVLTNIRGTLSVDEEATFDANVIVTGDLTVNGTTTTIDTTNLLVEDPLIVLAKNQTGAAALDQGIVFQRQGDNQGMIWDESADEFVFASVGAEDGSTAGNVAISSYAKLHIGDLDGASAILGGTLSVTGDMTGSAGLILAGDADLNAGLNVQSAAVFQSTLEAGASTLSSAKISDLSDNRVVIAGAAGELEDDANFTFDGALLNVGTPARATKIEIDSASDYIDIDNAMKLNSQHGAFQFMTSDNPFGQIVNASGDMKLTSNDIIFAYDDGSNPPAEIARIDGSASSLLINGTKKLEFNDAAEAVWSSGAELMLKSNSVSYSFPQADAAAADYVLVSDAAGQLSWKSSSAASSAAAKKINVKLETAISSANVNGEYEYDYSGFSTAEKSAILAATNSIIDVYVNGQLLVGYKNGTPIGANADYDWDTDAVTILFAFALEVDDVITVIVR